jgi:hypothetical protein
MCRSSRVRFDWACKGLEGGILLDLQWLDTIDQLDTGSESMLAGLIGEIPCGLQEHLGVG